MLRDFSNPYMQPRFANRRCRAFTVVEMVVVVAVLLVIAAILLPVLASAKRRASKISCRSNVRQVNLALRIWEGDNNNEYPMQVSVTNGGGREWIETGDVAGCFRAVSNELSTPRILICPEDTDHTFATNFENDFNNSHISYFLGVDVTNEESPKIILDGDDNFELNGAPVKSGLFDVSSNAPIAWSPGRHAIVSRVPYLGIPLRHNYCGNISFADGSVQLETFALEMQRAFQQTGLATNRLAIP